MKKLWIEMVQDYVDARMAVGGCILGIICFGVAVWVIIDIIQGMISIWSEIWPVYIIGGSLYLFILALRLVVEHSSPENLHRNAALVAILPLLVHVASVIVVFATGDRLQKVCYGIALILSIILHLLVLLVQIRNHKQQQ